MPATYQGYIDWNNDGDFNDTRENVSARILDREQPIKIRVGRDQARAMSPVAVGEAHFTLNNRSRDYSPENTSSPLNGNILPARPVRLQGTLAGVGTVLFAGTTDNFAVQLDLSQRWVEVDCLDPLGQLRGASLDTDLFTGLRSGDAIHAILDAAGWPAALRDIDAGASVFPYWWLDGDDAFQALLDVVNSEGPPALITVDANRRIVFRDRHHRLQRAASTTAQSTWRSGGIEPCFSAPADYNTGFREIANVVSFSVPRRSQAGIFTPVWSAPGITGIAAGDTLEVVVRGSTPFSTAQVPTAAQGDYTLLSGSPVFSLSRAGGAFVTLSIYAAGGVTCLLQDLQMRALPLVSAADRMVVQRDWSSIAKYGPRSLPNEEAPKWSSPGDARAIAILILTYRAERLPTISVTMLSNEKTARIGQILNRNLSDRVRVKEGHTGLDADCFIEQIEHTITGGGTEHAATFGLEKAPAQSATAFLLGTSVLGTGTLGKRGLADPATMMVLGTQATLGTHILTA